MPSEASSSSSHRFEDSKADRARLIQEAPPAPGRKLDLREGGRMRQQSVRQELLLLEDVQVYEEREWDYLAFGAPAGDGHLLTDRSFSTGQ